MIEQPETRLWLLRARTNLPHASPDDYEADPWYPPYDKCHGLVVEATTEERARAIANAVPLHFGFEDRESTAPDEFLRWIENLGPDDCDEADRLRGEITDLKNEGLNVWLDPKYTTCEPLVCTGNERRVIWDVMRG